MESISTKEKIKELLEGLEDGTITAAQVTESGLHRSVLQEFVKSGEMYHFGRGLYARSSVWKDDFSLLQRKYGRGIYSHNTALYPPVSYTHLNSNERHPRHNTGADGDRFYQFV